MSDLCLFVYLERCTMHSIWWQSAESIQKNADPLMQNLERMLDGFRGRLHASYTTGGSLCEGWRVSKTAIHKCCQVQHIAVHIICYSQVTSEDTERIWSGMIIDLVQVMSLPASPEEMGVIRQARFWLLRLCLAEGSRHWAFLQVEDRFGVVFRNMEVGEKQRL